MTLIQFLAGLLLLVVGAEALVRGASRLAQTAGLSPLVIGLTVVAFGTSAPELAVSLRAALNGQAAVALGNVVGSNTFNVLLILGLSAMVAPLAVKSQLVKLDVPLMMGVSLLVIGLAWDGSIGRFDGGLLFAGIVAYSWLMIRMGKADTPTAGEQPVEHESRPPASAIRSLAFVAAGLALLVLGANWLVSSAVTFATSMGVSELVIGLTIVAAGTSLPELVTSVVASLRGERDIAVGNVVGSNLFNLLGVLGVAGLAAQEGVAVSPEVLRFDLPVMAAVAVVCLPVFYTGMTITRWEGGLLVFYYVAYTAYVLLAATGHAMLPGYRDAMLWGVLPATVVTLVLFTLADWRRNRSDQRG